MKPNSSISVLIPAYRSEATLPPLIKRLTHTLASMQTDYEVILINDGSPDRCWEIICELAQEYQFVHGINLTRNFGQHNALLCGIRAAQKDVIVTMDADLQNPPEEIPNLLAKLAEGHDVVYGTPEKKQQLLWRDFAGRLVRFTMRSLVGSAVAQQMSNFRAFRTSLRQAFRNYEDQVVIVDVLLTWGTRRFSWVPVRHDARTTGTSNYSFIRLLTMSFNLITSFTTVPLRIASWVGFLFTLFGIGVLIYVVSRYMIMGYSVPGFPFLASIIAIFAGSQLFALGIIGEYLARMHFRLMNRPAYVIRESTTE